MPTMRHPSVLVKVNRQEQRVSTTELAMPTLVRGAARCVRCKGLLVPEHIESLRDHDPEHLSVALRCVQCGDVIDPVILVNRGLGVASDGVRSEGKRQCSPRYPRPRLPQSTISGV